MPALKHLLAAALAAATAASGLAAVPTQHEALEAIATLERSVAGPDALAAARTIVIYAQLSDDVLVDIGPEEIPWAEEDWGMDGDREKSCQSVLLAAFVAGNIRSQIKNNRVEDDTYSGWIFVISAYNRLRQREHFSSPSIEALLRMQTSGTLLQHAREVEARASQEEEPAEKKPMA